MTQQTLDAAEPAAAGSRRLLYLTLAFPVAMVGLVFLSVRYDLGWIGATLIGVFAMAMTLALVRAAQEKARALGCSSPAMLRYNRRMMVSSLLYMATLLFAVYLYNEWQVRGPLLWAAAIATSLPVLGMIWAMGRLVIEEEDEYLRSRIVNQALFGTGGLLVLATVWGFLEQFMLVPHVPAWAAVPVFAIMLGASQLVPANRR